jgi:carboxyl-terminal processing protease
VRRAERSLRFAVFRSYLIPETVGVSYEDGILYLAISDFNQGASRPHRRYGEGVSRGLTGRLRGIVLDLRGDSGGLLQQSIKVADLFLSEGQILSTRGRHPDNNPDYVADGADIAADLPLVILIDGVSACAAEMSRPCCRIASAPSSSAALHMGKERSRRWFLWQTAAS